MTKKTELSARVQRWTDHEGQDSVSLYIDCRGAAVNREAFSTRLKNAVRDVGRNVDERNREPMTKALSGQLPELERLGLGSEGLVVFQSPQALEVESLWFPVEDALTVGVRFALKPLLGALSLPQSYFVLALCRRATRFLEIEADTIRSIELDDSFPLSLEEAQATLESRALNWHSTSNGEAVFHGQTPGERREHEDLKRFLSGVAKAVELALTELPDERRPSFRSPIVLAGVHELTSAFRREAGALPLAEEGLSSDPQRTSDRELAERASAVAQGALDSGIQKLRETARSKLHTSQIKSGISDILHAAQDGRVEVLFVRRGAHVWGGYDAETRSTTISERADGVGEDLLDRAATETFKNGGQIYELSSLDMPFLDSASREPACALLRY